MDIDELVKNLEKIQYHFNGMIEAYQKLPPQTSVIRKVTIEDAITVLGSMYEQIHLEIIEMGNRI
jgi:hypothetical protein|tara:strand:+ start:558 stop:752 length:195 start_codon:yes stop_codon:yes gene_type:complete